MAELEYQSSYVLDSTTPRTRTGSGNSPRLNFHDYKARIAGDGIATGHWDRDEGNLKFAAPQGFSVRSGPRNEDRDEFQTSVHSSRTIADSPYRNVDRTGPHASICKTPISTSSQFELSAEYPGYGTRSPGLTSLLRVSRSVPIAVRANSSPTTSRNIAVNMKDNRATFDSITLRRKSTLSSASTSDDMRKIKSSPKGLRNPPTPDAFAATLSAHSFVKSIETSDKKVNSKVCKNDGSRKGGSGDSGMIRNRHRDTDRDSTSPVVSSALKIIRAATGEKIEIDSDSFGKADNSDVLMRKNPSLPTSNDLNRSGATVSFSGMRGDRGLESNAYRWSADDETAAAEVGRRRAENRIFDSWTDEGKGKDQDGDQKSGLNNILSVGPRSASPFGSTESLRSDKKLTTPVFTAVARSTSDPSQSLSQSIARTRSYLESDMKSESKRDLTSSSAFGSKSESESEAGTDFHNEGGQETPSEILRRMRNRLQHQSMSMSMSKYSTPSSSQRSGYIQGSTNSRGQNLAQIHGLGLGVSLKGSCKLGQGQGLGLSPSDSDSDSDSKSNSGSNDFMDRGSGLESIRPKISLWMEEEDDRVLAGTKQVSDLGSGRGSDSGNKYGNLSHSILLKEGVKNRKEEEEEDDSLGLDDDDSAASNERYQKARATLFTLMHHKSPLSN